MDYLKPPPPWNSARWQRQRGLWVGSKNQGVYPLSGYTSWYKADDAASVTVVSGTHVSQWNDQTGTSNWTQGTDANRPFYTTRTLNGLNVIDFNGSSSKMTSTFPINDITCTVFIVGVVDSLASFRSLITPDTGTQSMDIYTSATNGKINVDKKGIGQRGLSSNGVTAGTGFSCSIQLNDTTCRINLLGTVTSQVNASTSFANGTADLGFATLDGAIAEIMFYNTMLSDAQTDINLAGLRSKWGVS